MLFKSLLVIALVAACTFAAHLEDTVVPESKFELTEETQRTSHNNDQVASTELLASATEAPRHQLIHQPMH